jgi:hypothetical protein
MSLVLIDREVGRLGFHRGHCGVSVEGMEGGVRESTESRRRAWTADLSTSEGTLNLLDDNERRYTSLNLLVDFVY